MDEDELREHAVQTWMKKSTAIPTLPSDISETMKYLHAEFADELSAIEGKPIESIQLSSVYTRITGIAGQPLNDNNLGPDDRQRLRPSLSAGR